MTFTASTQPTQPPEPTQSSHQPAPAYGQTQTVAVVAESTCCLPPELVRELAIGIIPIPFVFGEQTYLDGVDITPAQFYRTLAPRMSRPRPRHPRRASIWRRGGRRRAAYPA